jgi:hypothetical protein
MAIDSIKDHSQAFKDREYLNRWFPEELEVEGKRYSFGRTEMAVIEEVLRHLEQGESILIRNPIPSDRLPVGICLAYIRTQDPRFVEDGIVGESKSLLSFPALHHGYVSKIDEFREEHNLERPKLINREPIDKLPQTVGEADMHTAKNNFEFKWDEPSKKVGVVFVDLRKSEWGKLSRRFDAIKALYDNTDCHFVFYTDEMTSAAKIINEEVNKIELVNELMKTADPNSLPDNPSLVTRLEHIIDSNDIKVEQVIVGYPKLYEMVSELSTMKNSIQNNPDAQGGIKMEVGWLFNLLTRLPVKPEYWDDAVEANYYQQGIRELVEKLRSKAQKLNGKVGNTLINYCQVADSLHGKLNERHPLQDALLNLITKSSSPDRDRVVVVKNNFERKSILKAITLEGYEISDNVSIRTPEEIDPIPDREVIVARPLDDSSYIYDFPTAERIAFLQFEPWAPVIEDRLESGIAEIGANIQRKEIGKTGGMEDKQKGNSTRSRNDASGHHSSQSQPKEKTDPTDELKKDFSGRKNATSVPKQGSNSMSSHKPDVRVKLSNGEMREWSAQSKVNVLRENDDISRKQVKDLELGETILLLDSVADDIYDTFVESAHQKEKLRKAESTVESWRGILKEGLSDGLTEEQLLTEMKKHGSEITDTSTISCWRTGECIGPRDPEDVRRVLKILKPEMEPTYEATADAMKRIRKEHRDIGRKARKAIESQMQEAIVGDITTDIPEDINDVSEDVREATVEDITRINEE